MQETGLDSDRAASLFQESGNNLSVALVMAKANVSRDKAAEALSATKRKVEDAVKLLGRG
jgi:N-acetylmuramic acid 6-phosphate (MurNAc-6-P) etherase